MLECLVNVSHCQRLKTFSECFEIILKRYRTSLSSVGEHYQRVKMHLECSPTHSNVFKCVAMKTAQRSFHSHIGSHVQCVVLK